MLNEILDKCKSQGEKRGLKYINKVETLTSGKKRKKKKKKEAIFVKGKE